MNLYILDLQDTGGYDSDGKSIKGDGRRQPVTQTISHPTTAAECKELPRPSSPTCSTHSSEFESENLFIRLKQQRENLLNEVARAGGFERECLVSAQITGVSRDMVGSSTNPINLNLPWSDSLSEHVSVHEKSLREL
jgi:hypothetical protein